MRKNLASLLLTLAIAFSAGAQQRPAEEAGTGVERLRTHVFHLASEKLEGRRTGTPGANMAAEYIAREFSRYGLKRSVGRDLPGMSILEANSPRRYMQEFPYVAGVEVGKNSSMLFTPQAASTPASAQGPGTSSGAAGPQLDLRLGEDWMPLPFSSSAKVLNARAVFVGYGLKADELNRDDYAGTGVANRIAIAFAGTPDGDNPHGQFARYADVRFKAVAARNSGAAALVIIATAENLKDDRLAHLSFDN